MSYATGTDTEPRPVPTLLPPFEAEPDLLCMMCGRIVGRVVDGKARQHAGCAGRLRIEHGLLRCCHCNGKVYRDDIEALG